MLILNRPQSITFSTLKEYKMSHKPKWLFVSDVDDTLLGDDAALERLAAAL